MSKITPIKQCHVNFQRAHTRHNIITNWDGKMEKKTPTLWNEAFTVDGFSKGSSILWCSGLRMALLCCCNTLPPNRHAPHSAAQGPSGTRQGP